jgi:phage tail-like protein
VPALDVPGPLPIVGAPPLGFRFGVLFLALRAAPNPLDTLFQKVSGLGASVATAPLAEGGQNLYAQLLPRKVEHDHLILERGLIVGSPLALEFNAAMSLFRFKPSNVLVTLLDHTRLPIASWLCMKAYPVKWSVSDLDATNNSVVIERMELAYQSLQTIRL